MQRNANMLKILKKVRFCRFYWFLCRNAVPSLSPELPATTLAERCYQLMFYDCKKLDNITMLATDISATNCLDDWVDGVASTGTFTKAASLIQGSEAGQIPTGISGIPEGWTVVNK